ncbi:MAG TPA: ParB/RepB/Spo0J family partition protein [Dehalococcoidia bacterium]|jgi:ParB family chromosome partitioning protein
MTTRRSGLGRGLDALIPSLQPVVEEVDVDLIAPNPEQPRTVFDAEALTELADSIREHGVIQPLIVSRRQDRGAAPYQLIAGERRLLAARQAGLQKVPVIVKEASSQALLELALVENLQRQDLGPLEEASAFRRLADEFKLTQEAIAGRVGRSRSGVANSLRLLTLPEEMQASLARGEITAGHARALLAIDDTKERHAAWRRIVDGHLTVRDAESMTRGRVTSRSRKAAPKRRAADLVALEERLRGSLGTKVDLTRGRRGGRVVIHYYSDEELEAIIGRLSQA